LHFIIEAFMANQSTALASKRSASPTVDELIADPARANQLGTVFVPDLLIEISSRVAALKTLEGALLSFMLSRQDAEGSQRQTKDLVTAPELAKLWGVPETWVRDQARMGRLPHVRLGHYVRFRPEEVERFLSRRASQAT